MFKNKLLRALLAPFLLGIDDLDTGGGGGGSFDMDSAVSAIGEGLGFGGGGDDDLGSGANSNDDLSGGDGSEAGARTPSNEANPADGGEGSGSGEGDNQGTPPAGLEVPKTWRAEAAAEWAKLSPTVQSEILKREQDIFQGLEGYKADASIGKNFKSVFAPYEAILAQAGADPVSLTNEFMQAHMTFATGSQEAKINLLNRIIKDYGIQVQAPGAGSDGEAPYTDPQVSALQQQIKALESQLSGVTQHQTQEQQRRAAEARAKVSSEIDAFAKDPANVYFDELTDDITRFIKSGMDLKQAYDAAVWANPATRAKEQARQTAEATAKAQKEAAEKAAKARQATAANVRTTAKNASGTAPLGSMDDTLRETYARLTKGG